MSTWLNMIAYVLEQTCILIEEAADYCAARNL